MLALCWPHTDTQLRGTVLETGRRGCHRVKYITIAALGIRREKQDGRDKTRPDQLGRPTNSEPKGLHIPLVPKFALAPNLTCLEHEWTQTPQTPKPAVYCVESGGVPTRQVAGSRDQGLAQDRYLLGWNRLGCLTATPRPLQSILLRFWLRMLQGMPGVCLP